MPEAVGIGVPGMVPRVIGWVDVLFLREQVIVNQPKGFGQLGGFGLIPIFFNCV